MARTSLRKKIQGMNVNESLRVPKDYEETTIRNTASRIGSDMSRVYSVSKTNAKSFTIVRIA